ncbi:unnamed protein product [Thlaspi arvense]|uniref:DUF8040 domain-containing protein n=1 Tax=Thlaspi arvense TaxID=13288 RepID=A0AAU9T8E5_THLAR|nr:unnamed protein product [Thlaspi arvense]
MEYNYWIPRKTEILLSLVNIELKTKDYAIRMPDNPGKRRIEEKYYELIGDRIVFEPEMRNRLEYMHRLRQHYNMLVNRTGVREARKNGKYFQVLESKPLPFKELLGQIYGEHDLDQDERCSLMYQLEQAMGDAPTLTDIAQVLANLQASMELLGTHSDDGTTVGETAEENGIQTPFDSTSLRISDDEITTRELVQRSPPRANRSSLRVRSTSTKRTNRRKVNFETQIQSGFQRTEESRTSLLDVLRSQHQQKATFGDALALLEALEVEPMGRFWWAANRLLMNEEEVRDGFMKLRSEDNKIRFLERLSGIDRYGDPCQIINLRETCNIPTSSLPMSESQMAGFNTSASTSFWSGIRNELRIAELLSCGTENLSDKKLTELILMEEDEILQAYLSPAMDYYCKFFCKEPINQEKGGGWRMIQNQIYEKESSCRTLVRMSREAFTHLCRLLKGMYGLQDTHSICVDESVTIFLILCGQNDTQYDLGLRFGHAQETIGRKFHEVLGAMERMAVDYLRPHTIQEMEAISDPLEGDTRYSPFFSGFVEALDATHIPVMVTPGKESIRFISRK